MTPGEDSLCPPGLQTSAATYFFYMPEMTGAVFFFPSLRNIVSTRPSKSIQPR